MSRRLILVGLITNGVILTTIPLLLAYNKVLVPLRADSAVTELDRAGVISEEQLRAYDPALAENIRNNLGKFITKEYRYALDLAWTITVVVAAADFVIFLVLLKSRRWGRKRCQDNSSSPSALSS